MQGVTHYMIDELEPDEEFHVVRFVTMAKEYLKEIYADGKIPIIAGGTGFYIQVLLYDIDFTEQQCDETYRSIYFFCQFHREGTFPHRGRTKNFTLCVLSRWQKNI